MEERSLEISHTELTVVKGKWNYDLTADICPPPITNMGVFWRSSNPEIVTVNHLSGAAFGVEFGNAKIEAYVLDNQGNEVMKKECNVSVVAPTLITSIEIASEKMVRGEKKRLKVTILPENASTKKLEYFSFNESVAKVTKSGYVMALKAGVALVGAISTDGSEVAGICLIQIAYSATPSDEDPATKTQESYFSDPIEMCTGAHVIQNCLMKLNGGQMLKLSAHYNSSRLSKGKLGNGWCHNYEKHIEIVDNIAYVYENPSSYSEYIATTCQTEFVGNEEVCVPVEFECVSKGKNGYILTKSESTDYSYVLDCNSQRKEYYDVNKKLSKVESHDGFVTLLTYSETLDTITDTVTGKKIYLQKNANGLVERVYDDAGRVAILTYDSNDSLIRIQDVNGNTTSYTYDEKNRIKTGTDSTGVCYFTNTYDEYGRVIEQKDGVPGSATSKMKYECGERELTVCQCCEEETITQNYDNGTRETTNRLGKLSRREFDVNGLLVKYTDENGNIKTYEYDERNNIIRETDANGNCIVKEYNLFNKPTSITDKNGNKTTITYDDKGNITKIAYPVVNGIVPEESYVYNDRNQVLSHSDMRGTVTVFTYDTNGMLVSKKVGSKPASTYSYSNGLLVSETDPMGNITRYSYNTIGQMTSKTDAMNHVTEYEYDNAGNLICLTDANDKSVRTLYDGNNQKTSVTDARGNTTSYIYNGNLKNTKVTLPDGHSISYEYDGEDRLVRTIDQAGKTSTIVYDDAGRVISKVFADSGTVSYTYDAAGNLIKETNAKGAELYKTYDKNGNVLTVRDHAGNTTRYQYNAMSKVVRIENAVAGATIFEYSKAGDLLSETDALGNKKEYTYDAYGNRLTAKDAKGNVTTYTYDHNNNLLTVRDAKGNTTTYTYNCLNQCVSVKDAKNNVIRYGYDALGRRTTITDAKNNVYTTYYDENGNVVKTTDAKGNIVSETTYNSLNKPLTVKDAAGKTTTYTYNVLGLVATVTDSMNHRQEYTYDNVGRNTAVKDALDNTSTATFDYLGNIVSLNGPSGGGTNYTYDSMGRLTSETTVSGGTVSYTYTALNLREKLTNARGQERQFFYDAKGRITGYTTPEDSVSYTYDANDNVLTVTDENGTVSREYDELNRITKLTDTYGKVIRYEYDEVGNLTRVVYPDNTAVSYTYDANYNLITVTDWANRVTSYTYDVNNRVVSVTKPDGSVTTTAYDNMQRVTSTVERTSSGAVITGFEYSYDDLSRIVEEKVLANSTKMCYTYDSLNRVTKRTVKNMNTEAVISEETYSYDAAGNIVGDTANVGFVYDTNNRLVTFNSGSITYDLDGNMLGDAMNVFTYDSSNRLITANGHTYTYNAEDVRIRKLWASEDTTYTYDTNRKLSRLLEKTTNGITTKYVYGHGLICEETNSTIKTYHFDNRGSTIAITDASGNVTDTFEYDTYGKLTSRTGTSDIIFRYNGRDGVITDFNGLAYMRARYYSPNMRRFINADIIHGTISDSTSLNRYSYVNGNPVSFVDPFGLSAVDDIAATFGLSEIDDIVAAYNTITNVFENGWDAVCEASSAIYYNIGDAGEQLINGNIIDWGVDKFKELTREGKLDNAIDVTLGARKDEHGVYHIDQSYWQSLHFVGYNDLYDMAFVLGVGITGHTVDKKKFEFTTKDGTRYIIWMWKGDYINLGSGAEVGIYRESVVSGHWLTSNETAMPMHLKLQEIDSGRTLFDYCPLENQWWINGFSPSFQNANANNLCLTVTIDFSKYPDMYGEFRKTMERSKENWVFNGMQATYSWRK